MLSKRYGKFTKAALFIFVLCLAGLLAACGKNADMQSLEPEIIKDSAAGNNIVDDADSTEKESSDPDTGSAADAKAEAMREMFGENCIVEQTFEVELSEYSGKVYFVPFMPSEENPEFSMQIIQNGEVLTQIRAYVPDELANEKFSSLDAVSFFDVNYDSFTDIVLIETYGDKSFAAIYYGFDAEDAEYARYFWAQDQLSAAVTDQVDALTILSIRNLLTGGKKNGEFTCYQEAYYSISILSDLESDGREQYNLIYVDGDDIPELAVGVEGYYVSLYTYHDGKVYMLMDQWGYGAFGNAGYEYAPRKNNLRNDNADYAGLIVYTSYMKISDKYSLDVVAQIETYNFDDSNGNGMPDENEEGSAGYYSVSYLDGVEITDEVWASYNAGDYEFIVTTMSLGDLRTILMQK